MIIFFLFCDDYCGFGLVFLEDFMFGLVMVVYQIEGVVVEDGCILLIWDMFSKMLGWVWNGDIGDVVCDYYYCVDEDFDLMVVFGLQVYWFLIVWLCIVFIVIGEVNQVGVDFYFWFVDGFFECGICLVVMLYYWDLL